MATNTGKAGGPAKRRGFGWLLIVMAIILAVAAPGALVFAAILLGPSLAVLSAEGPPARPLARAMALFAVAASIPSLMKIWQAGGGLQVGMAIGTDPVVVARAWGACGLGWLLAQVFPALLMMGAEAKAQRKLAKLNEARAEIHAEWSFPEGET